MKNIQTEFWDFFFGYRALWLLSWFISVRGLITKMSFKKIQLMIFDSAPSYFKLFISSVATPTFMIGKASWSNWFSSWWLRSRYGSAGIKTRSSKILSQFYWHTVRVTNIYPWKWSLKIPTKISIPNFHNFQHF